MLTREGDPGRMSVMGGAPAFRALGRLFTLRQGCRERFAQLLNEVPRVPLSGAPRRAAPRYRYDSFRVDTISRDVWPCLDLRTLWVRALEAAMAS